MCKSFHGVGIVDDDENGYPHSKSDTSKIVLLYCYDTFLKTASLPDTFVVVSDYIVCSL